MWTGSFSKQTQKNYHKNNPYNLYHYLREIQISQICTQIVQISFAKLDQRIHCKCLTQKYAFATYDFKNNFTKLNENSVITNFILKLWFFYSWTYKESLINFITLKRAARIQKSWLFFPCTDVLFLVCLYVCALFMDTIVLCGSLFSFRRWVMTVITKYYNKKHYVTQRKREWVTENVLSPVRYETLRSKSCLSPSVT